MVIDPLSMARAHRPEPPQYSADENARVMPVPAKAYDTSGRETVIAMDIDSLAAKARMMCPPGNLDDSIDRQAQAHSGLILPSMPSRQAAEKAADIVMEAVAPSEPKRRVVINYGRKNGEFVLSVERSPDWDIVGKKVLKTAEVKAVLKILSLLDVSVKDYTDEEWEEVAP